MLGGILLCVVLFFRNVHGVLDMFSYSAENSAIAIINTAVVVGFGSVVQASPGISEAAGFRHQSGKYPAPAGLRPDDHHSGRRLRLRLRRFGYRPVRHGEQDTFLPAHGPGIVHRVGSAASVGLDSLPHNGAVITLLTICANVTRRAISTFSSPRLSSTRPACFSPLPWSLCSIPSHKELYHGTKIA